MENLIKNYLKKLNPKLCVFSTVDPTGKPQSAVMAYAIQDNLSILLSTHESSRKWKNIMNNPWVALTFGWDFANYNIQYEGKAEPFRKNEQIEEIYYATHPELIQYKNMANTVYILIKPTWMRISNLSAHPPVVQEKFIT